MREKENEFWDNLTPEEQKKVMEEHGKIASMLVGNSHESAWMQYKQQCEEQGHPLPKELEENLHSVFNGGMMFGCHMGIFNTYIGIAENMRRESGKQKKAKTNEICN